MKTLSIHIHSTAFFQRFKEKLVTWKEISCSDKFQAASRDEQISQVFSYLTSDHLFLLVYTLFFLMRMLFFRPRLNILIFLPILG